MLSTLLLSTLALVAAQNLPTIQTPAALVTCEPAALTFSGGTAPYFISVLPGGQVGAAPLEFLPTQSGGTYTWNVDIAAGTSISLQIKDSTGATNYAQAVTVQQGPSTSCIGQNSLSSGAATGAATSASASSTGAVSLASSSSAANTVAGGPGPVVTRSTGTASSGIAVSTPVSSTSTTTTNGSATSSGATTPSSTTTASSSTATVKSGAISIKSSVTFVLLAGLFTLLA